MVHWDILQKLIYTFQEQLQVKTNSVTFAAEMKLLANRRNTAHLPVNSVFISLESVVDRGAHAGGHGVGVRGVRVLVGVQLGGPVVEVHSLHGARAVRVSVHGARDAHTVHPVVGQVFVLHTTQHAAATVNTHAQRGVK